MQHFGIILLDNTEVLIRLFERDKDSNNILMHSESHDLANFERGKTGMKAADIIEVIAEVSFKGYSFSITDWKISSRNIPKNITKEVSLATGMNIESMTLSREQELIFKGLSSEF